MVEFDIDGLGYDHARQTKEALTRRVVNAERLIEAECYGEDHRSTAACVPMDRSRLASRWIDHGLRHGGSITACVTVDRSRLASWWIDHGLRHGGSITACVPPDGSITACVPVDRSRLASRWIDHGLRHGGSITACVTVDRSRLASWWIDDGLQHGCITTVASRKSIGADPMLDVS